MKINNIEFPDECPKDCSLLNDFSEHGQNSICGRCPIFVCSKVVYGYCLVEPEEYREDWAIIWKQWFDDGMKGCPKLKF